MNLWDCGGGETDVNKRQMREEEIHGSVEMGVINNGQNDEQVTKHSD